MHGWRGMHRFQLHGSRLYIAPLHFGPPLSPFRRRFIAIARLVDTPLAVASKVCDIVSKARPTLARHAHSASISLIAHGIFIVIAMALDQCWRRYLAALDEMFRL